jgi:2-keto-3-deoxy-galactonokinase
VAQGESVTLIGSNLVCAMYAEALSLTGVQTAIVDAADATSRGFAAIHAKARLAA